MKSPPFPHQLDVQILRHHLRDRLEWDLCSPLTPENFARTIRSDLGLSGESDPLIANAVREQLLHHKRAALELGLVGSGAVFEHAVEELRIADEEESLLAAGKSLPPEREEAVTSSEPRAAEVLEGGSSPAPPNPDLDPTSGFSTPGGPAASAASAPLPRPTPTARRSAAISVLRDLSSRGPRPLEGVWRDWGESREFGPLLEVMTAEELERLEEANVRASRCVSVIFFPLLFIFFAFPFWWPG